MNQKLRHLIYLILLVIIDQVSKYWARVDLRGKPITLIQDVFKLQYHENTGAVWGIMSGQRLLLIIMAILILSGVIYVYSKIPEDRKLTKLKLIFIFIMAGAIGNLIDRIYLGYVVDFIYFELINFPIFNIADSYLTVSCIIFIGLAIFYYKDDDLEFLDRILSFQRNKNNQKEKD